MNTSSLIALTIALAVCFAVAGVGAKVTTPQIPTWYAGLRKPPWTPPRIAFPIVWPILYFLMAISVWRFWEAPPSSLRTDVLLLFAAQLTLNAVWSPVFFGAKNIAAGLAIIVLLALCLTATIIVGFQVDHVAALLLLPYIAWTAFATALNARIWTLN
jgi:benzodiazapine receptor